MCLHSPPHSPFLPHPLAVPVQESGVCLKCFLGVFVFFLKSPGDCRGKHLSYIHQRNVKHWSVDDDDNVLLADFWFIKRSNQDAQRTSFFEINALPLIVFYLSLCTNRPHLICWKVFLWSF